MTEFPGPPLNERTRPYWDGLQEGELRIQRCAECEHRWLPVRDECPRCWSSEWSFEASSGRARLVSWVIYHRAYHPYFADKLPYNVSIVELDEGPRLITNVVGSSGLVVGMALELAIEREGGVALARFEPLKDPSHGPGLDSPTRY